MTGISTVPDLLEDAIKSVAYELGFPDDRVLEIERVDSKSDVLSSAYTVMVKSYSGDGESGMERCVNLFVKCMEDKDGRFQEEGKVFFKNEVMFYGGILEAAEEFQKCPQISKFSPKCYRTLLTPSLSYIIMENLLLVNYLPLPPLTPPTLPQYHQILDSLARLHSLSFILKDQHPLQFHNIVDGIQEPLFREEMRPTFGRIFVSAIHDALKLAKRSLPAGSVYVDRLAEFTLNVFDKMVGMAQGGGDYKVVTHGDLRLGNVLIKCDKEGKPVGACFLDYQACRYSSPAHDLAFFLLVSVPKPLRDAHLPSLIHRYHGTLCTCIAQSGSDPLLIFPMSALRAQLTSHARFALGLALAGLPLYMDEGRSGDMEGRDGSSGDNSSGDEVDVEERDMDVVEAAREASGRKSMKCKNKMMEVIIDAVDVGWL